MINKTYLVKVVVGEVGVRVTGVENVSIEGL